MIYLEFFFTFTDLENILNSSVIFLSSLKNVIYLSYIQRDASSPSLPPSPSLSHYVPFHSLFQGHQPTLAYHVARGLGTFFPVKPRQGSSDRGNS